MDKPTKTDLVLSARAEQEVGRRRELLEAAPPSLRKEIDKIQKWFEREAKRSIQAYYELARIVKAIHDDVEEHHGKRYGAHALATVCQYFAFDESTIQAALRMAKLFTAEEIAEICEMRMADGQPLSYSHVRVLYAIHDRQQRRALLERAAAECWTSDDLGRAVARAVNRGGGEAGARKPADGRGRPLGVPRTFDAVLLQQGKVADDFLERSEKVWEDPQHGLGAKAGCL